MGAEGQVCLVPRGPGHLEGPGVVAGVAGQGQRAGSPGKVLSPHVSLGGQLCLPAHPAACGHVGGVCHRRCGEGLGPPWECWPGLVLGRGMGWVCEGHDPGGVSGCVGLLRLGPGV